MAKFDLTSLELFASVVEHRNIAQASRINNIAASAVSKRISDIEARLGVALLYRQREGVEPTPAGQALYRHAKQMAQLAQKLDAELSEYSGGVRGRVRLWTNTSAIVQFLPDDLGRFARRFPEIQIELREDTSERVVDAVRGGLADIGIFSDHVSPTELDTRLYKRDTLMVIVPVGHPLSDLEHISYLETTPFNHVGLQQIELLQADGLEEATQDNASLGVRATVRDFEGIRQLVAAGLGIAIMPEGAVAPYLGNAGLKAVRLRDPWASRSLVLGFREYRSLPGVARSMIECLASG